MLANQNVPNPMIFCIQNTFLNKMTYVGVLEFVADEGTCILPNWVIIKKKKNIQFGKKKVIKFNKKKGVHKLRITGGPKN